MGGFIYVLMERMFDQYLKFFAEFYNCKEDTSPWLISDIRQAIYQLESFNLDRIEKNSISLNFPYATKEVKDFYQEHICQTKMHTWKKIRICLDQNSTSIL